jgi:transposase
VIEKVLTIYDPPNPMGRPRSDARYCFDGIIFRLRTGCQWNHLPKEFGHHSPVYHTFVRRESKVIFDILWAILLTKCDELPGVDWHWQSANGCLGKARGILGSGIGKRGVRINVSVLTPVNVASRASSENIRKACWSNPMACL